ncbi:MAG TPA: DNA-formamidopyrimidine glycosylase family protein, partial [Acidimicrobiales bacterium]|nr:DNA-formamidopyrimidine glycosylase family protein [Acidimicrobiales bacterium]
MPELPEVEALTSFVLARARGRTVVRCELAAIAALKTVDPALDALIGRPVVGCERRGKYLCASFEGTAETVRRTVPGDHGGDDLWLVVHLARGGWLKW